jgi:hypothetical protein
MHGATDSLAHQPSQRNKILEGIARFIGRYKPGRILRIAVDGVDKTMFAKNQEFCANAGASTCYRAAC